MKDSEFIELLNLYLDHEISAADAARLEAEVLANPARRRIYEDYCRMQKACKVLARDFATEAPAEPNVVAFASARPARRYGLYGMGALVAAAAAVALIFVGRQPESAPQPELTAQAQVAAPAPIVPTATPPAPAKLTRGLSLASKPGEAEAAILAGLSTDAAQFEWLHTLKLEPLQQRARIEDLRFENRATFTPVSQPLLGGAKGSQVESAAFSITK